MTLGVKARPCAAKREMPTGALHRTCSLMPAIRPSFSLMTQMLLHAGLAADATQQPQLTTLLDMRSHACISSPAHASKA